MIIQVFIQKGFLINRPLKSNTKMNLYTKDLAYSYHNERSIVYPDFEIEKGEHLLLRGPSGSGKSTLLQLLGGLLPLQTGTCEVFGQSLHGLSSKKLDNYRKKQVGYIFQKSHFVSALSVKENLQLAAKILDVNSAEKRIKDLLSGLDLDRLANKKTYQISEGEQQRLSIARAVLHHPPLILADEPTSSLDDENTGRVMKTMLHLAEENGSSLIVVSHDQRISSFFHKQIELKKSNHNALV